MPAFTLDGDVLVDITIQNPPAISFMQANVASAEIFVAGPQGPKGNRGTLWYSGVGAPAGSLGVVQDWYLNTDNGDAYEKTGEFTWTLRDNLTGRAATDTAQTWTRPQTFAMAVGTDIPVTIRSHVNATANLTEWRNSSGSLLTRVDSSGQIFVQGLRLNGSDVENTIFQSNLSSLGLLSQHGVLIRTNFSGNATGFPLVVRPASAQTADIQQWQNSAAANLAAILSTGDLVLTGDGGTSVGRVALGNLSHGFARGARLNATAGTNSVGMYTAGGPESGFEFWHATTGLLFKIQGDTKAASLSGNLSFAGTNGIEFNGGTLKGAGSGYVQLGENLLISRTLAVGSTFVGSQGASLYVGGNSNSVVGDKTIVARAIASQTGDIQQWQNSAGAALASVNAGGAIAFTGQISGNGKIVIDTTDTYVRLNQSGQFTSGVWLGSSTLKMASGATSAVYVGSNGGNDGNIAILPHGSDNTRRITLAGATGLITTSGGIASAGSVGIGPGVETGVNAELAVRPYAAGVPGIVVRGFVSQTADLEQWQSSAGTVLSRISSSGQIYEGGNRVIGAFGQHDLHAAHATTGFDGPTDFGSRFIQSAVAGPGIPGAIQYYNFAIGLGAEYSYSSHAMQWAVPRTSSGGNPYLSFRYRENGTWGGWQRVYAGYADTAGTATPSNDADIVHKAGSETITGAKTFSAIVTASAGLTTGSEIASGPAGFVAGFKISASSGGATQVPYLARGFAGQTADLQQWQNSAGSVLARVEASGLINAPTVNAGSMNVSSQFRSNYEVVSGAAVSAGVLGSNTSYAWSATIVPYVARGFTAQTADLTQWQNTAGVVLARVSASGQIFEGANRVYSAGNPPPYPVTSVAGRTGAVVIGAADVGAGTFQNNAYAFQSTLSVAGVLTTNGGIDLNNSTGNKSLFTWTAGDANWRIGMHADNTGTGGLGAGFTRTYTTGHVQYVTYAVGSTQGFAVGPHITGTVVGAQPASHLEVRGSDGFVFIRNSLTVNGTLAEGPNRVYSAGNPPPATDLSNYVTLTTTQTISGAKSFSAGLSANARAIVQGGTGTGYSTADLEVVSGRVGGPVIALHWSGAVASTLGILSDGTVVVRNNPGTGYEKFRAAQIDGSAIFDNGSRVYSAGNLVPVAGLSATGTKDATTFLRGDNTWAAINISNMVTTDTTQTITGLKSFTQVIRANHGGPSTDFSATASQLLFGYAGGTSYTHGIRTRHNAGAQVDNAIDFFVWNLGVDAVAAEPTMRVLALDGSLSTFYRPLRMLAPTAASVPATVQGGAGQTADLMQFKDSAGAILARVANDGTLYKGGQAVGGNAADTEIMSIMGGF